MLGFSLKVYSEFIVLKNFMFNEGELLKISKLVLFWWFSFI